MAYLWRVLVVSGARSGVPNTLCRKGVYREADKRNRHWPGSQHKRHRKERSPKPENHSGLDTKAIAISVAFSKQFNNDCFALFYLIHLSNFLFLISSIEGLFWEVVDAFHHRLWKKGNMIEYCNSGPTCRGCKTCGLEGCFDVKADVEEEEADCWCGGDEGLWGRANMVTYSILNTFSQSKKRQNGSQTHCRSMLSMHTLLIFLFLLAGKSKAVTKTIRRTAMMAIPWLWSGVSGTW